MASRSRGGLGRAVRADPRIRAALEEARACGFRLYLVGGWIRDRLLGRETADYDFAVQGDPAELARRLAARLHAPCFVLGREVPPHHRVRAADATLDLARLHRDGVEADLARRDFTVNALAWDLEAGRLLDPLGGLADLGARRLVPVSERALDADPLRLLRGVRLEILLPRFAMDPAAAAALRRRASRIQEAAGERTREELDRIMASDRAVQGLRRLRELGLLARLLPEVEALAGLEQGPHHHLDALEHTLAVVEAVTSPAARPAQARDLPEPGGEDRLVLAYGALFHDAGKAAAAGPGPGPRFPAHAALGAGMVRAAARRMAWPRRRERRVAALVRRHLRGLELAAAGVSERAVRRAVHALAEDLPLHCLLFLADAAASRGPASRGSLQAVAAAVRALVARHRAEGAALVSPPRLVTGRDVMEILGIGPGPAVGRVLAEIRRLQVDGEIRDREAALQRLRGMAAPGRRAGESP